MAQLVSVAWKCSAAVYSLNNELPETEYCRFHADFADTASLGGTVKAVATTIVRGAPQAGSTESENAYFPVLVVAIRGSASMVDHMVNANGRPTAASHFVVGAARGCLTDESGH